MANFKKNNSSNKDFLYIKKIEIKNIRSFEKIELDLSSADHVKKWSVIFGDNGTGKSTFLRCLALGLCDKDSATALLKEQGDKHKWIRKGSREESQIKITLTDSTDDYIIITKIEESSLGREKISQSTIPQDLFPWEDIFACGYGAGRGTAGEPGEVIEYSTLESVLTLFNYDVALQHSELLLRRIARRIGDEEEVLNWLADVLLLRRGSVKLNSLGITIDGPWGAGIYVGSLPDGYEATLTWVVDLLGWSWLSGQQERKTDFSGIVLIDELEQHLHPKWQQQILSLLQNRFPKIQFFVSTHSPLLAMGTTQLIYCSNTIALFTQTENEPAVINDDFPYFGGWNASQILGSQLFDWVMPDTNERQELFREAAMLEEKGQKRTTAEDKDFEKIKSDLKKLMLTDASTKIESRIGNELYQDIKELTESLEKDLWGEDD